MGIMNILYNEGCYYTGEVGDITSVLPDVRICQMAYKELQLEVKFLATYCYSNISFPSNYKGEKGKQAQELNYAHFLQVMGELIEKYMPNLDLKEGQEGKQ